MKIDFIGTGKIGCKKRANTSVLIDDKILFDIGSGVLYQLKKLDKDLCKIKYLFISHYHADHFPDIADFLANFQTKKEEDNINELLTIIGPKDIKQKVVDIMCLLEPALLENNYENIEKAYNLKFVGLENTFYSTDDFEIESVVLKHGATITNNGYTINLDGKIISYTGDTALCEELYVMIKKSDILLIDSSYIDTVDWHIGLEDVIRFAEMYPLKKFYAIHRSDYSYEKKIDNLYFSNDGESIII